MQTSHSHSYTPSPSSHPHRPVYNCTVVIVWTKLQSPNHTHAHPHHYTLSPLSSLTPSQGPEHCNQCRNYYLEEMLGAGSAARVCVEVCSQGTYLNRTSRQCIPCHEACQGGCAGPLPYVNRTHGCLECDRVQLDRDGRQVREGGCTCLVAFLAKNILARPFSSALIFNSLSSPLSSPPTFLPQPVVHYFSYSGTTISWMCTI